MAWLKNVDSDVKPQPKQKWLYDNDFNDKNIYLYGIMLSLIGKLHL